MKETLEWYFRFIALTEGEKNTKVGAHAHIKGQGYMKVNVM